MWGVNERLASDISCGRIYTYCCQRKSSSCRAICKCSILGIKLRNIWYSMLVCKHHRWKGVGICKVCVMKEWVDIRSKRAVLFRHFHVRIGRRPYKGHWRWRKTTSLLKLYWRGCWIPFLPSHLRQTWQWCLLRSGRILQGQSRSFLWQLCKLEGVAW